MVHGTLEDKMKKSVLIFSLFSLLIVVSAASQYPPDYDYEYKYVTTPPSGLSAGWSGDDVYVSWDRTKDNSGNPVEGYRLYRAANENCAYIPVNTTDGINNDDDYYYDPIEEKQKEYIDEEDEIILTTYYMDTASQLSAAGIYQSAPFSYMVTAVVRLCGAADDVYHLPCFESNYSSPIEIARESDCGCFVATAAFGSPLSDEVQTLCSFRDEVLMQTKLGRNAVNCYYRLSPPAADFIREKPPLRLFLRLSLKPVIILIKTLF